MISLEMEEFQRSISNITSWILQCLYEGCLCSQVMTPRRQVEQKDGFSQQLVNPIKKTQVSHKRMNSRTLKATSLGFIS